jgi:hypothetical protein
MVIPNVRLRKIEYSGRYPNDLPKYFVKLCKEMGVTPQKAASEILTARVRDIYNGKYIPTWLLRGSRKDNKHFNK